MPRYLALLRAINVSGHTIKMDALRQHFETLGFKNIETFIASGNVIFETASKSPATLEKKIEAHLHQVLGYPVATFLRTPAELTATAQFAASLPAATALNLAFLKAPLAAPDQKKLLALKNAIDDFRIQGRELYWLCLKKQSESKFSNAVLEKTLRVQATLRGANTVAKLAEKYGG